MAQRLHKIMSGKTAFSNVVTRLENNSPEHQARMMQIYGALARKLTAPASCTRYSPQGRGCDAINVSLRADYQPAPPGVTWLFHACYISCEDDDIGFVYGTDAVGTIFTAECPRIIEVADHASINEEVLEDY